MNIQIDPGNRRSGTVWRSHITCGRILTNIKSTSTTIVVASVLQLGCSSGSSTAPIIPVDEKYKGNYLFPCSPIEELGETFETQSLEIMGTTGSSTTLQYSDAECTQPFENGDQTVLTYSFEYPGGTTETALGIADHINITVESALVNGIEPSPELELGIGNTTYDIVLLNGAMLHFGGSDTETSGDASNDGLTAETRHTMLDSGTGIRQ